MTDTAIDDYVDQFDTFPAETQERVMDSLRLVQRLAKRRAQRNDAPWIGHALKIEPPIEVTPVRETAEAHDARLDRQMAEQAASDPAPEENRPRLAFGKKFR